MAATPVKRKVFTLINETFLPANLQLGRLVNKQDGTVQLRITAHSVSVDPEVELAGKAYVAHIVTNNAGIVTGECGFELLKTGVLRLLNE